MMLLSPRGCRLMLMLMLRADFMPFDARYVTSCYARCCLISYAAADAAAANSHTTRFSLRDAYDAMLFMRAICRASPLNTRC